MPEVVLLGSAPFAAPGEGRKKTPDRVLPGAAHRFGRVRRRVERRVAIGPRADRERVRERLAGGWILHLELAARVCRAPLAADEDGVRAHRTATARNCSTTAAMSLSPSPLAIELWRMRSAVAAVAIGTPRLSPSAIAYPRSFASRCR